jgi:hypothetical protein
MREETGVNCANEKMRIMVAPHMHENHVSLAAGHTKVEENFSINRRRCGEG